MPLSDYDIGTDDSWSDDDDGDNKGYDLEDPLIDDADLIPDCDSIPGFDRIVTAAASAAIAASVSELLPNFDNIVARAASAAITAVTEENSDDEELPVEAKNAVVSAIRAIVAFAYAALGTNGVVVNESSSGTGGE